MATARDDGVDRLRQAGLVVGVDRGNDLGQAQADAPQRRIKTEGARERLVDREPVGGQIPEPGADDGAGSQRQLHPLGIDARIAFVLAQHGLVGHLAAPGEDGVGGVDAGA